MRVLLNDAASYKLGLYNTYRYSMFNLFYYFKNNSHLSWYLFLPNIGIHLFSKDYKFGPLRSNLLSWSLTRFYVFNTYFTKTNSPYLRSIGLRSSMDRVVPESSSFSLLLMDAASWSIPLLAKAPLLHSKCLLPTFCRMPAGYTKSLLRFKQSYYEFLSHAFFPKNFSDKISYFLDMMSLHIGCKDKTVFQSSWTSLESIDDSKYVKTGREVEPLRIFQMKPGYQVIWREYRAVLASITNARYYRQRRWTNYVMSYKKFGGSMLLLNLEFSVSSLLQNCLMSYSMAETTVICKSRSLYIGGRLSLNPKQLVFFGEVVQLVSSPSLARYHYLRAIESLFVYRDAQLRWFINFFANRNQPIYNNMDLFRVIKSRYSLSTSFDIPNYVEVDFVSSTIVILYSPIFLFELNPLLYLGLPLFAMRVYNWKYVN